MAFLHATGALGAVANLRDPKKNYGPILGGRVDRLPSHNALTIQLAASRKSTTAA